jgi:hypothetical protein
MVASPLQNEKGQSPGAVHIIRQSRTGETQALVWKAKANHPKLETVPGLTRLFQEAKCRLGNLQNG